MIIEIINNNIILKSTVSSNDSTFIQINQKNIGELITKPLKARSDLKRTTSCKMIPQMTFWQKLFYFCTKKRRVIHYVEAENYVINELDAINILKTLKKLTEQQLLIPKLAERNYIEICSNKLNIVVGSSIKLKHNII